MSPAVECYHLVTKVEPGCTAVLLMLQHISLVEVVVDDVSFVEDLACGGGEVGALHISGGLSERSKWVDG